MEKLIQQVNKLSSEVENKNRIIANQKQNLAILTDTKKFQEEIKKDLEMLNSNITILDNPMNERTTRMEELINMTKDKYHHLSLKIEIV